jgi:hypothetical protein
MFYVSIKEVKRDLPTAIESRFCAERRMNGGIKSPSSKKEERNESFGGDNE